MFARGLLSCQEVGRLVKGCPVTSLLVASPGVCGALLEFHKCHLGLLGPTT